MKNDEFNIEFSESDNSEYRKYTWDFKTGTSLRLIFNICFEFIKISFIVTIITAYSIFARKELDKK